MRERGAGGAGGEGGGGREGGGGGGDDGGEAEGRGEDWEDEREEMKGEKRIEVYIAAA